MKITNNVGQYVIDVINCNLKFLRMTQKYNQHWSEYT
jgi:hypothetical protein